MSKTKKIFLLIAVALVILAAILFFFFKKAPAPQNQPANPALTSSFKFPSPNDPTMTITTPQGKTVQTNNVYKNELYPLSQDGAAFNNDSTYYAAFYPQDQGFLIVIHDSDVKAAEAKAETAFLKQLGITQDQACQLKVSITVPQDVSEQYSGQVYGLSFCPGSNVLK